MDFDYFIIGQGIAGTVLAHTLEKQGASFLIIDNERDVTSSKVAAGLFNPVTGKRVVKTWKADEIFPFAESFYKALEVKLEASFYHPKPFYKPYQNIEEQNDVIAKSADKRLDPYVTLNVEKPEFSNSVNNSLGAIQINKGGYLDTVEFLKASKKYFDSKGCYASVNTDLNSFDHTDDSTSWQGHTAKKAIFCEGYRAKFNPLWSWLPFSVTKGEMLEITINDFPTDFIVNKGAFILPKGGNNYLVGSSYEHSLDETVSEKGKQIVMDKLSNILTVDYSIVGQRAAIRPTVRDRRPYIGIHPDYDHFAIFNGMGTKGVTLSPFFADEFVKFLETGTPINREANIERYSSLYDEASK